MDTSEQVRRAQAYLGKLHEVLRAIEDGLAEGTTAYYGLHSATVHTGIALSSLERASKALGNQGQRTI